MKKVVRVCQVILGALYVFSGFVKADDPLGFTYKLQEYFAKDALNFPSLDKFCFSIAFSFSIIEMTLGFMMLLGARKKLTLVLLTLMTLFFTFLTWYTAHYNKVLECGCFGDAIPMTSWQSFYKNIALLVLIAIIAIGHKHIYSLMAKRPENILVLVFLAGSILFSLFCYNYLPVIDFRPYKVGTDIKKAMQGIPDVDKFYYTLKDKKTGETKEFDKFPDNYQANYDYVSSRTEVLKKGVEAKIKDFSISDMGGNDVTDSVLSVPGYHFFLVSKDIAEANTDEKTVDKINALASDCNKNRIGFICLTACDGNVCTNYQAKYHAPYKFYSTDGTTLKTMIRSNPGLVLLKGSVIIAMWHYHSIPAYSDVAAKYLH